MPSGNSVVGGEGGAISRGDSSSVSIETLSQSESFCVVVLLSWITNITSKKKLSSDSFAKQDLKKTKMFDLTTAATPTANLLVVMTPPRSSNSGVNGSNRSRTFKVS